MSEHQKSEFLMISIYRVLIKVFILSGVKSCALLVGRYWFPSLDLLESSGESLDCWAGVEYVSLRLANEAPYLPARPRVCSDSQLSKLNMCFPALTTESTPILRLF